MIKQAEPRICIWCQANEIEHSFDIPLCVPCLVKIHHITTDRNFDTDKLLQEYLAEKIEKQKLQKKNQLHITERARIYYLGNIMIYKIEKDKRKWQQQSYRY